MVESVCFGNWWRRLSWVVMTWTKVSPRQNMGSKWCSIKLSGWVYRTFVTHVLTRGHLNSCYGDWGSDVCWVAKDCTMVSPRKRRGSRLLMFEYVCFLCVWCCVLTEVCWLRCALNKELLISGCELTNFHWLVTPALTSGHLRTTFGEWWL